MPVTGSYIPKVNGNNKATPIVAINPGREPIIIPVNIPIFINKKVFHVNKLVKILKVFSNNFYLSFFIIKVIEYIIILKDTFNHNN